MVARPFPAATTAFGVMPDGNLEVAFAKATAPLLVEKNEKLTANTRTNNAVNDALDDLKIGLKVMIDFHSPGRVDRYTSEYSLLFGQDIVGTCRKKTELLQMYQKIVGLSYL